MLKRKLSVIIWMLSSSSIYAFPKVCPTPKEIAKSLLLLEVHGRRLPEYSSCLKNVKSDLVLVRPEQNDEAMEKPPKVKSWVKSFKDISIEKVDRTSISERYQVSFSYPVNGKNVSDSMIIETYEGSMKKLVGCGAISEAPKEVVLLEVCRR